MIAADITGDGLPELILGNGDPLEPKGNYYFRNLGTFDSFNSMLGKPVSVGLSVTAGIAAGDVDGDGRVDVADGIHGQLNTVTFALAEEPRFPGLEIHIGSLANATTNIALADLDLDGDLDLIEATGDSGVYLFMNDGDSGRFETVRELPLDPELSGVASVAAGDLDGDGDPDIVVGTAGGTPNLVYLNRVLDREELVSTVTVRLTDVENETLVFDQRFQVRESSPEGTLVGRIRGNTVTPQVEILAGNEAGAFAVHPTNGELRVADASQLDYETKPRQFTLTVRVTDAAKGNSNNATVTVAVLDVNEPPVFVVAPPRQIDVVNSGLYDLLPLAADGPFATDEDGDEITLAAVTQHNFEVVIANYDGGGRADVYFLGAPLGLHRIVLSATDERGASSLLEIEYEVVRPNLRPVIDGPSFVPLPENSPVGTFVAQLSATDEFGGDTLTFKMCEGGYGGAFTIDPESGVITVANPAELNFEANAVMEPIAIVTDNFFTTDANTYVSVPRSGGFSLRVALSDVNEPPSFEDQVHFAPDNAKGTDELFQPFARDVDSMQRLTFELLEELPSPVFHFDPDSGRVSLVDFHGTGLSDEDYRSAAEYVFRMRATDDGVPPLSAEATVTLVLTNIVEDQVFMVAENRSQGDLVGFVETTLGNADFVLEPTGDHTLFELHPRTGQLNVKEAAAFDHELRTDMELTVTVSPHERNVNPFAGVEATPVDTSPFWDIRGADVDDDGDQDFITSWWTIPETEHLLSRGTHLRFYRNNGSSKPFDKVGHFDLLPCPMGALVSGGELYNYDWWWLGAQSDPAFDHFYIGRIGYHTGAAIADIDDDGDLDVVRTGHRYIGENWDWHRLPLVFFYLQGAGRHIGPFEESENEFGLSEWATQGLNPPDVHDFNRDGSPDLVRIYHYSGGAASSGWMRYYDGLSGREVLQGVPSYVRNPVWVNARREPAPAFSSLAVADFDGDGDLDIAVGTVTADDRTKLYYNNGSRDPFNVNDGGTLGLDVGGSARSTSQLRTADVNGDGLPDLLEANLGLNRVWINDGSPFPFYEKPPQTIGQDSEETDDLVVGDVDMDGDLDVITVGNGFKLYLNDGTDQPFAHSPGMPLEASTEDSEILDLADYDGDGDLDILEGVPFLHNGKKLNHRDYFWNGYTQHHTDWGGTKHARKARLILNSLPFALEETSEISVRVEDVNEPPVIHDRTFIVHASRPNGSLVGRVHAEDPDEGQELRFAIAHGDPDGVFAIDPVTGLLSLADRSLLDFNEQPAYRLTVTVTDNGFPSLSASAEVFVRVNDVDIQPQEFTIVDSAPNGTVVGDASATANGLRYTIVGGNLARVFSIQPSTGVILLANSAVLDASVKPLYVLQVQATREADPNSFGIADVRIHVRTGNQPPAIQDQSFLIRENAVASTLVGTMVATDPNPDATLLFSIVGGNELGAFLINPLSGRIQVANSATLNFEAHPSIELTVLVEDTGTVTFSRTATATVNLIDVNDRPAFLMLPVTNAIQGKLYTYAARAVDEDAGDVASLLTPNVPDWLTVERVADNEIILTGTPGNEQVGRHGVTLVARDTGQSQTLQSFEIEVSNVNDRPVMDDQMFSAEENLPNGAVIGVLAAQDIDVGDRLTFRIDSAEPEGIVSVNELSGALQVQDSARLNHEATPRITLTATVRDNGSVPGRFSATADIVIDVLDVNEPPRAEGELVQVDENLPAHTEIGRVAAHDEDPGDRLSFEISEGNTGDAFAIHPETGVLTVNDSSAVDYESSPVFVLKIAVIDDGEPARTTLVPIEVRLNDRNDPPDVFDQTLVVSERDVNGVSIGRVFAYDQDGDEVRFFLAGGNDGGAFSLDRVTGFLRVQNREAIDFESQPVFTLHVRASDGNGGPDGEAVVMVRVIDGNDRPSIDAREFVLSESAPNGTVVGNVSAIDADAGQTLAFEIVAGNDDAAFSISENGDLAVADTVRLDFESRPVREIVVRASDDALEPLSTSASMTIRLTDANDAPTVPDQVVRILENTSPGAVIGSARATDQDAGDGLTFAWSGGNEAGWFELDAVTGEIRLSAGAALDFETAGEHALVLRATDDADSGPAFGEGRLTVRVIDVNDAPEATSVSFAIDENPEVGLLVGTVSASDEDAGQALVWSIQAGNDSEAFRMGRGSGELRVRNPVAVDFEANPEFNLHVAVTDNGAVAADLAEDARTTVDLVLGDLDGDGDLDAVEANSGLAARNRVYLNPGGEQGFAGLLGADLSEDEDATWALAVGDVDGDRDLDVIAGNASYQRNRLYLNNGTSTPFDGVGGLDVSADTNDTRAVVLADFNRDGRVDLVVGNSGRNRLHLNDGNVSPYTQSGRTIGVFHRWTTTLVAVDIDGDGDLDLVEGNFGQPNRMFLNNGGNHPFEGVVGIDFAGEAGATFSLRVADLNGDGTMDVIEGNQGERNRFYLNNGTRTPFTGIVGTPFSLAAGTTGLIALGDVDGDGDPDLIEDVNGAPNRILLNGGRGELFGEGGALLLPNAGEGVRALAAGDMDGDGDLDVVEGITRQRNRVFLLDLRTTRADVVVNVGDLNESPTLRDASFSLPENSPAGWPVGRLRASDQDADDEVALEITAGNEGGWFLLDEVTGLLTVAPGARLDFEEGLRFRLTVVASDSGEPALTVEASVAISLANVNDPPSLPEAIPTQHARQGDPFRLDLADFFLDQDGDTIAYSVSGLPGTLKLGPGTGVVGGVPGNGDFLNSPFMIEVVARDGRGAETTTGFALEVANVNDAPILTTPIIRISGFLDEDWSHDLGAPFRDPDNDPLTFAAHGFPASLSIDPATGVVTGRPTQADFDRSPFAVAITATDPSNEAVNAAFSLLVLSQDNVPRFADSRFRVQENAAQGALVGAVKASVRKLDQTLAYEILPGPHSDAFVIDAATGAISVRDLAGLDFEAGDRPSVEVRVRNLSAEGVAAAQSFEIELTDGNEPPVLESQVLRIPSNSQDGTVAGVVVATDPDATPGLRYRIVSSSAEGAFALNPLTGEVVLADATKLNAELQPEAHLVVEVTDEPLVARDLTSDLNAIRDMTLGDIDGDGAVDLVVANSGSAGRVYLGGGGLDPFSDAVGFNFSSGSQTIGGIAVGDLNRDGLADLAAGLQLRNNQAFYNSGTAPFFDAGPVDLGSLSRSTAAIGLGDLDGDGDVDMVAANGGTPITLYFNDGDDDPFSDMQTVNLTSDASFVQSIDLGDVDNDGDLDVVAAVISGRNRLYLNNGSMSPFAGVGGIDIGADRDETHAIKLADVNDDGHLDVIAGNYLQPNRLYLNNGTLNPFGGAAGSAISGDANGTQSLALADVDRDGDVDVLAGNGPGRNRLYLNNGSASPFGGVAGQNFTEDADFTRRVAAVDLDGDGDPDAVTGNSASENRYYMNRGVMPLTARAVVTIQLTGANRSPVIGNQAFVTTENVPPGTAVGTVQASDPDDGQTLSFAIVGGNDAGLFEIGRASGVLRIADGGGLDYEAKSLHPLTVEVLDDSLGNSLSRTAPVTVIVTDVNDRPTLNPINSPDPMLEDGGERTITLFGIGSGAAGENQVLSITAVSDNPTLLPHPMIDYSSPNTVGFLRYQPARNRSGVARVTVTLNDGGETDHSISRQFEVRVLPVNDSPLVAIAQPADGARLKAGRPVQLAVLADDVDGRVKRVEFLVGSVVLGESLEAPYVFVWDGAGIGEYVLSARAYDDDFGVSISRPTSVSLNPAIHAPRLKRTGEFEMEFVGMRGINYELQHSSNLIDWRPVVPPVVIRGDGSQAPVVDPSSVGVARRYYRFVPLAQP